MDYQFKKFYRDLYLRTGYIPTKPIDVILHLGDFFQISNGSIVVLGNIFQNKVIQAEDLDIKFRTSLAENQWQISSGVQKVYSGRGVGENPIEGEFNFSRQIYKFDKEGSFMFHGKNPESASIVNWNHIQNELIVKLTQTLFSFRDIYVVFDVASLSNWTLAVSDNDGELELATEEENFGLSDIFGHSSTRTVQSKNLHYHHRADKRRPNFFKAKKLTENDDRMETFMTQIMANETVRRNWAKSYFEDSDYDLEDTSSSVYLNNKQGLSSIEMLQINELNPNTVLNYYKWSNANLDDIERLFLSYENMKE